MRGPALVVVTLLLAACGAAPSQAGVTPSAVSSSTDVATPATAPTSSASASPSPSPTPSTAGAVQAHCVAPIPSAHPLALVETAVVRSPTLADVTDPAHPVSLCTITGRASNPRIVGPAEIAYTTSAPGGSGSVATLELTTNSEGTVASWTVEGFGSGAYAIAPNGQDLAYLASSASAVELHLVANENDRTIVTLPPVSGRDLSPDDDAIMLGFSSDGRYLAMVETVTGTAGSTGDGRFQVRRGDGSLIDSEGAGRTMAAWSGRSDTLYFRDDSGVERWTAPSSVVTVLPGVRWIRPSASADGRWMAYTVRDSSGLPHAYVLDLIRGGPPRLIAPGGASDPVFLTPTAVWYQAERLCQPSDNCGMGPPSVAAGQSFLYEVGSGRQAASSITAVIDTWSPTH